MTFRSSAIVAFGLFIVTVGTVSTLSGQGQNPLPRIWEGVFTEAQANRGQQTYQTRCAHCHAEDLTGGEGPSLVGSNFHRNWGGRHVDRLFKKIVERMPPEEETSISEDDKLDILAHILRMNGFPAGKTELPNDPAVLADLLMVGRDGPAPAPTGAMVAVAGCLTKDASGVFRLINAQEPTLSSLDDHPPDEAKNAAAAPPGTQTFRLVDAFPAPDQHVNKKMLAKGLLIRATGDNQVNVLALEPIAPTCN
jgi:hypothetical protein